MTSTKHPQISSETVLIKPILAFRSARAIASIVLAFNADPVTRWMYPIAQHYLTYFPQIIEAFGDRPFEYNTADATDDESGAALWFPPDTELDSDRLITLFQESIHPSIQDDLGSVLKQMDAYHPQQPHWYLALLGVDPARQQRGYGTALMRYGLSRCDRDGAPAYLESSNPANIPFYQRHGFEVIGTIQAGNSPEIFPMLRPPQL